SRRGWRRNFASRRSPPRLTPKRRRWPREVPVRTSQKGPQGWQRRYVMETALTYTLQKVHWQFFGTLTFKPEKLPERIRLGMYFALIRRLCRWHKVPWR